MVKKKTKHCYVDVLGLGLGLGLPLFCQGIRLWIKMEFFAWIRIFPLSVVMLSYLEAKSSAFFRRSWLMDG